MTNLVPYLSFDGNCREAMEFYNSVLGGSLDMQTIGESPMDSPPEIADRIMHSFLKSDDVVLMAADAQPGMPYSLGNNVSLTIVGEDEAPLRGYFDALADGGMVMVPFEKQFWGDTFGMCSDKYGVNWMVNVGELKGPS